MGSCAQEILGLNKALDRLEERIKLYRNALLEFSRGHDHGIDIEQVAITTGEVETIEALILDIAERASGTIPNKAVWEPMHAYCSRNEQKKDGVHEQNYEYFRWALLWIEKTRTYLVYLRGQLPEDETRGSKARSAEATQEYDVPPHELARASGVKDCDHIRETRGMRGKHEHDVPRHEVAPSSGLEDGDHKPSKGQGRYIGRIVWTPLPDGRVMQLVEAFGFVDPDGVQWPVPLGAKVDGASIPQSLWSIVGSPFTGQYRDASVVHDYYCATRLRAWKAVHRVFYDAMIVSGVGAARAKLMYAAVYFGGPRWDETDTYNSKLPQPPLDEDRQFSVQHTPFTSDVMKAVEVGGTSVDEFLRSDQWMPPSGPETRLHLKELEKLISEYDPSPEQIAAALDTSTRVMDAVIPKQRTLVDVQDLMPDSGN